MLRDGQGCSEMLRDAQRERDRERARETQRKNREERKHGKRREEKDQQEAILILKKICTTQTPDRPPLAAILVYYRLSIQKDPPKTSDRQGVIRLIRGFW